MAHKKGVGSSRNGRDSNAQRRGIKEPDGKLVKGGSIIVRQVGNKFWPGDNVAQGKDFTLFARVDGRQTQDPDRTPLCGFQPTLAAGLGNATGSLPDIRRSATSWGWYITG